MIESRYNDILIVDCWLIDPVVDGFTSLSVKSVCLSVCFTISGPLQSKEST